MDQSGLEVDQSTSEHGIFMLVSHGIMAWSYVQSTYAYLEPVRYNAPILISPPQLPFTLHEHEYLLRKVLYR